MNARDKRLLKELAECHKDKASGISIAPIHESDNTHLVASFDGPLVLGMGWHTPVTFFAAQTPPTKAAGFKSTSKYLPIADPFGPLKMKFITKIYHPNISSASGAICLDILKTAWSPVYTLKTALVSLQSLLNSPEPSDPQDAEVAKVYLSDHKAFEATARYWTQVYATGDRPGTEKEPAGKAPKSAGSAKIKEVDPIQLAGLNAQHVEQFTSMGFDQARVIEVLARLNYRGANIGNISDDQVVNALLG